MAESAAIIGNVDGEDNSNGPGLTSGSGKDNDTSHDTSRDTSSNRKPSGETNHAENAFVGYGIWNYQTLERWYHRVSLWEKHLANNSDPNEVPDITKFLFSGTCNSIPQLIFGEGKDSFKSRCEELKDRQSELAGMQSELADMQSELAEMQSELAVMQSELADMKSEVAVMQSELAVLENNKSMPIELPSGESINVHYDEPLASQISVGLTISCELLAELGNMLEKNRKDREERIMSMRAGITLKEKTIKFRESSIKSRDETIKSKRDSIKSTEKRIKSIPDVINMRLQRILDRHQDQRYILHVLAGKGGNATTETRLIMDSELPKRLVICVGYRCEADSNFLSELLSEKKDILRHQDHLVELQTFVAGLVLHNANNDHERIKASVDAILHWNPGTSVDCESLGPLEERLPCPASKRCETTVDQSILCALIYRILALLGHCPLSGSSEQVVDPVGTKGQGCSTDSIHDEYMEFLHVRFPRLLGAIQMKQASQDDPPLFQKTQRKARRQVVAHLAKQLLFAFDFGGMGENDVVCGVVLSMCSVQVLEMQLEGIGTDDVHISFRQTAHVPLLGARLVPETMHEAVDWDMGSNGVLLLASALVDLSQKSPFGRNKKPTMDDVSAAKYYSSHGQEQEQNGVIEIQSLLGSGGFCHVVQLGEEMFMKIPRSTYGALSLERECEILEKLALDEKPWFAKTMPWGVSLVHSSLRNEVSCMKVLRLRGIIGCPLGSHGEYKYLERKEDIDFVIQQVYDALEYAHSKNIFHMDVQPNNIIVRRKEKGWDVMLSDWGVSMLHTDTIGVGSFVGCPPYAHDGLFATMRDDEGLKPIPDFDFASLGYTWYHVRQGVRDWQFDNQDRVWKDELEHRRELMEKFFHDHGMENDIVDLVPKVRELFVQRRGRKKRSRKCQQTDESQHPVKYNLRSRR